MTRTKKKNSVFGRYPCCDLVNNAIRDIINGDTDEAISELFYAISKANGYFHDDIAEKAEETNRRIWEKRYKGTR